MQSARWERDWQVNSDSSNTVKRGRASKRKVMGNVCERKREKTGRDKKLQRNEKYKHLHSVLKSCVKGHWVTFRSLGILISKYK